MNHQFENSTKSLSRYEKHTLLSIKRCEILLCWQLHFAFLLVLPLTRLCLDGSQGNVPYFFVSSCASVPWEITVSAATFRAGKGDDETNTHECQQTTCTLNTWYHSSDPQIAHCLQGKQHQQALILLLGIRFQGAVPFESPILFRWEMMNSCLKTAAAESATTTISISTSQSAKKRSRIFQVTHEHKHILFLFPSSIKHHSLLFSTSVKKESIAISLNCSLPCSWWHLSVSSLSASF